MKTFKLLCGKYIQHNMCKILSESAAFRRWRDKNILVCLSFRSSNFELPFTYPTKREG